MSCSASPLTGGKGRVMGQSPFPPGAPRSSPPHSRPKPFVLQSLKCRCSSLLTSSWRKGRESVPLPTGTQPPNKQCHRRASSQIEGKDVMGLSRDGG